MTNPTNSRPSTSAVLPRLGDHGRLIVSDHPTVPFIEGDGTGPDIWRASVRVFDEAVRKAYEGRRRVHWLEVLAGEKARRLSGEWLPKATLEAIRDHRVGLKGPLTTPVGGGIRSLNVALRQALDLYACIRPVRYYRGTPSPVKHPERMDVVIIRENTEDLYAGVEWAEGTPEAKQLIEFMCDRLGSCIEYDSGVGVKVISKRTSKRLIRLAINYALRRKRKSVTLVHKGNIMKFTEGAFRDWGYEVATEEFRDEVVTEEEVSAGAEGRGKLLINDRIADSVFQQVLLRTSDYDVFATPNVNGDYLSDACAAQVGGLGMAPGANFGDETACFEATHGTAPKYAGKDVVNPGSLILSGVMMFKYFDWVEVATLIETALEETIRQKKVTYDLARQMRGATELKTSEFADAIVSNM